MGASCLDDEDAPALRLASLAAEAARASMSN